MAHADKSSPLSSQPFSQSGPSDSSVNDERKGLPERNRLDDYDDYYYGIDGVEDLPLEDFTERPLEFFRKTESGETTKPNTFSSSNNHPPYSSSNPSSSSSPSTYRRFVLVSRGDYCDGGDGVPDENDENDDGGDGDDDDSERDPEEYDRRLVKKKFFIVISLYTSSQEIRL